MSTTITEDYRIISVARHLVKTVRTDESMKEDMLSVLYGFDDRIYAKGHKDNIQVSAFQAPSAMTSIEVKKRLDFVGAVVMKWDLVSPGKGKKSMIWDCGHEQEAASYLCAVDKLQDLMACLSLSGQEKHVFDCAQNLLQLAMIRLEQEFRHLLLAHCDSVDPEYILHQAPGPCPCEEEGAPVTHYTAQVETAAYQSSEGDDADEEVVVAQAVSDLNFTVELLPADVISHLNDIARRMMGGGYARECCHVYSSVRKAALDHSLYQLGLDKLSIDDAHKMSWEGLEMRIKKWNQALKVAIKVLYASERILCEQVFAGMGPWCEAAFVDLVKGSILHHLSFGEVIASSRRSPEKLFKILDMYETLWDLLPAINSIFSDELCCGIRSEANGILMRLGEAARGTFAEFENAIQRDSSRTPVPGGAVHPLTRYVMNYLCFLLCYTGTLKRLLGDKGNVVPKLQGVESNGLLGFSSEDESAKYAEHLSPLGVQIVWSIVLLQCNLDGKSKLYKDIAQTYLFLMNNVHYIVQKVRQSELASLVGEQWIRKHVSQVQQHATNYVRAAWKKVLACLREDGLNLSGSFFGSIAKLALKDRFKTFNSSFEEVHRTQSTWIVSDPQLREELRIAVTEKLIPAYRNFCNRFQSYMDSGRQRERYIKYTTEDLEKSLLDLFEGTSATLAARRKSFSTSLTLAASFH